MLLYFVLQLTSGRIVWVAQTSLSPSTISYHTDVCKAIYLLSSIVLLVSSSFHVTFGYICQFYTISLLNFRKAFLTVS